MRQWLLDTFDEVDTGHHDSGNSVKIVVLPISWQSENVLSKIVGFMAWRRFI